MSAPLFLTDEHVPGPFVAVLRSIGYDVLRAKDEFEEGTADGVLLDHAAETDRVVMTCDRAFTVVDGEVVEDHAGVIYADQTTLQVAPRSLQRASMRSSRSVHPTDSGRTSSP